MSARPEESLPTLSLPEHVTSHASSARGACLAVEGLHVGGSGVLFGNLEAHLAQRSPDKSFGGDQCWEGLMPSRPCLIIILSSPCSHTSLCNQAFRLHCLSSKKICLVESGTGTAWLFLMAAFPPHPPEEKISCYGCRELEG